MTLHTNMNPLDATRVAFAVSLSCYEELRSKYGHTLTTAQAANELHMHPSHVRDLCQKDELPCVRVGNRWRIPTAKLAAILDGDAHVG